MDARIDNRGEIAESLGLRADCQPPDLVKAAYLKWGTALAKRLSGDFAIVVWDRREARLVALRDPFGVRPLYFRIGNGRIRIGSRVSDLIDTGEFNDGRVVEYLLGKYASTDATFFRSVNELPPGHVLLATATRLSYERYWRPPTDMEKVADPIECARRFRELFYQAVKRRLVSKGPAVIHVSGGLDSSAVACVADLVRSADCSGTLSVFGASARYPGLNCDESSFVDAVAQNVHFPILRWDDTVGGTGDLENPRIDEPGILSVFRGGTVGDIEIALSLGGTSILSGLGGDQLGIVDGVVEDSIENGEWRRAMRELLRFPGATTRQRLNRIRHVVAQGVPSAFRDSMRRFRAQIPRWLAPDLRAHARALEALEQPEGEFSSHVQRAMWRRLNSPEMQRNVAVMNAVALSRNAEYRFPYLDRDLVSFSLSIPHSLLPRPAPYARLHRQALADVLPSAIVARSWKAEFTPVLRKRIIRSQQSIGNLFDSGWASGRYVDRELARQFCRSTMTSTDENPVAWRQVWAILTLEAWMKAVIRYHAERKEYRT
jgi:asparagine synthase (glutamine-hydrolysing)